MKQCILIFLLLSSAHVFSGSVKTDNPERKPKTQSLLSEPQHKKIQKYSEMMADSKYSQAKSGLNAMLNKTRENETYLKSVIYQLLGHIASSQDDLASTSRYFKMAIDLDALPNATHFDMMLQRAQIIMMNGDNKGALGALDAYFAQTDEIPDKAFVIKAQAHARLKQFQETKVAIKRAIELSDKPIEGWYQLLLASHSELSEYQQMVGVLEVLIKLKPEKKSYWVQLAQVYYTLKQQKKALAVYELAYEKGLLNEERDFAQFYQYYSLNEIPYKAAFFLEKFLKEKKLKANFKRFKQLGSLWYQARETDKALVAYAEASKLADNGEMDLTRAYLYLDKEDFKSARSALKSALNKGGLKPKKMGNCWLLLGMSEASLKNYDQARQALNKAQKYEHVRDDAGQWLNHLSQMQKKEVASSAATNG